MTTLTSHTNDAEPGGARGPNWALIVTVALPTIAVIASFTSLGLVLMKPDPEMPEEYHWEGARLEADFAHLERAAAIGVHANLAINTAEHLCRMSYASEAPPPDALVLRLVHATLHELDRTITLRAAVDGYEGACELPPPGHWRVELADQAGTWIVRTEATGSLESLALVATSPSGHIR